MDVVVQLLEDLGQAEADPPDGANAEAVVHLREDVVNLLLRLPLLGRGQLGSRVVLGKHTDGRRD